MLVIEELVAHAVGGAALLEDRARHVTALTVCLFDVGLVEPLAVHLLGPAENGWEAVASAGTGAGVAIGTSHSILQLLC